jgi:hypothetical protein
LREASTPRAFPFDRASDRTLARATDGEPTTGAARRRDVWERLGAATGQTH